MAARSLPNGTMQRAANAMNALGERIASRGIPEEKAIFAIAWAGIETNPGRAHNATYAAKADFSLGMILFNPETMQTKDDFRLRRDAAHEFRHLFPANDELVRNGYEGPFDDDSEEDARKYADELFPNR